MDDITPLRALTPETLAQDIVFIDTKPSVQRISGPGGWVNGDAVFVGPTRPMKPRLLITKRDAISWRSQDGSARFGRQGAKHGADEQASRPEPGAVDASEAAASALGGDCGRGRLHGAARLARQLHGQVTRINRFTIPSFKSRPIPRQAFHDDRRTQFDLSMKLYHLPVI